MCALHAISIWLHGNIWWMYTCTAYGFWLRARCWDLFARSISQSANQPVRPGQRCHTVWMAQWSFLLLVRSHHALWRNMLNHFIYHNITRKMPKQLLQTVSCVDLSACRTNWWRRAWRTVALGSCGSTGRTLTKLGSASNGRIAALKY